MASHVPTGLAKLDIAGLLDIQIERVGVGDFHVVEIEIFDNDVFNNVICIEAADHRNRVADVVILAKNLNVAQSDIANLSQSFVAAIHRIEYSKVDQFVVVMLDAKVFVSHVFDSRAVAVMNREHRTATVNRQDIAVAKGDVFHRIALRFVADFNGAAASVVAENAAFDNDIFHVLAPIDAAILVVVTGVVTVIFVIIDGLDRKSTRLNSSHSTLSRMPSSA